MSCHPTTRTRILAVLLAFTLCLLLPAAALAIPRTEVLSRAKTWVKRPVKYSQSKYHLGYRTDCSGYVSMCWGTGRSWSTATFHAVTHPIKVSELRPGDAMLKKGYHVRLFHHWLNRSHTRYVAWESGYGKVAVARKHSLWTDLKAGYVPTRHNAVMEDRPADDALWNGTFDAWNGAWGSGGTPVAWAVSGPARQTLVAHRMDTARTSGNSLQLLGSANASETPASILQTVPVAAGGVYRARMWARTAVDPSTLCLGLSFLDSAGTPISETTTSGARFALNDLGFTPVTMLATVPPGAVNARVSVRLAAPSGESTMPVSATIDDVSFVRLRASATIRSSTYAVRRSGRVTLRGVVSPNSTSTVGATVYVKPPGRGWRPAARAQITPSGGGIWQARYALKRGMRKGAYRFRTVVPGFDGYLGRTSRTITVRLK